MLDDFKEVGLVERARRFGEHSHGIVSHRRKYTNAPYFDHCIAVAGRVKQFTNSDVVIAAAYLHDTVEDVKVTLADLQALFPIRVAELVDAVTKPTFSPDEIKIHRFRLTTLKLNRLATEDSMILKMADIADNVSSFCPDPNFKATYLAEKMLTLEFAYQEKFSDHPAFIETNRILKNAYLELDPAVISRFERHHHNLSRNMY